eukprot:5587081-Pyramimonas_sp.AAC.1
MEGEADACQGVEPLSVADHQAMRLNFGNAFWKVESQALAKSHFEAGQTEIERGGIRAEARTSVRAHR